LRAAFFVLAHTQDPSGDTEDERDRLEHEQSQDHLADDMPMHAGLEARIAAIVAPGIADLGYELVRVAVLGRERPTVQIMADRADGQLINVNDCERISRSVSAVMDVNDPIPGRWTLEVSSAGIDRPLTRVKDWVRFAGHLARVELVIPVAGRKRISGTIVSADAAKVIVREGAQDHELPFADIRRAKLVLTDALIDFTTPTKPN
jgi:ribosome maturation factor RimP